MEAEIDTMNKFVVCGFGNDLIIANPPRRLNKADALLLAGWLVVMSGAEPGEFEKVREAIEST
jgi:hypothetical protein